MAWPRHLVVWGPHSPFRLLFFAYSFARKPKPQGTSRRVLTACGRRTPRKKSSPVGRNPGKFPPGGEIDAIVIVIELDIISIIIIISTIYTAITTAAPRHRCNNLGISMNEVRKKLFTISLSGKAAHWYKLLKNGDSIDWEDIVPLFYSKFYPPSEIHKDRNRIYNFWPHDGESIAQAWGRLKSLMLKCPIHELPGNVIIDNFYARLSFQDKTLLDTSCSGSFTRNKEEFKRDLLDRIQENTEGWENDKDRESEILVTKYSRNWTKSTPRVLFLHEASGRPKESRSGATRWRHQGGAAQALAAPTYGVGLVPPLDLPFRLQIASIAKPPYREPRYGKPSRDAAAANPISGDSGDRLRHPAGEGIHLPEDSSSP
ncbi:hypothetical protein QYE76_030778 [Lolium multiflorum]|uniref:Retrotransposon gag domain-containing protein n=1 Tax=Lolium multiflorum TaxID=4521 RepID=A0AAD8QRG5_LOLMU|nr:hypothetical protein QYE76_030778 [Lolium multiflorum]